MSDLSNSSNHSATSTQQVRQQLQTTADHYHQAIQQHSTLADLVRTAFNEADYAATTSQQAPSVPTHVHTVMQGGSPTATPPSVVSSVLHGIVAGLEDAGDDAIHMAHNVIQHVLAYDHAMNDPVHLARYVEQSALLGSAALNQAVGTATSIVNAIEHPSILMTAVEHSITGFMHEPLATQVEEVTHWGVSFFGPAAALKGAAVLSRSSDFFAVMKETDKTGNLLHNRTLHESYKVDLRQNMQRPTVKDQQLQRFIDKLYRPDAKVGSGSTADAVRYEMETGQPVGGSWHTQKAQDALPKLQRWLQQNPTASAGDRAAIENIIYDLHDALNITPRPRSYFGAN